METPQQILKPRLRAEVRPGRINLQIEEIGFGPPITILQCAQRRSVSAERGVRLRRPARIHLEALVVRHTHCPGGLGHRLHRSPESTLSIRLFQRLGSVESACETVILRAFLEPEIVLTALK